MPFTLQTLYRKGMHILTLMMQNMRTDIFFQLENLIEFLRNWICVENLRFFQCVMQLTQAMAGDGFWGSKDVKLVPLCLADLTSLGYKEHERALVDITFLKSDHNQTQLDNWKPRNIKKHVKSYFRSL